MKVGAISEGIFNLVPSSKKHRTNHCISTCNLVDWFDDGIKLKIPFEITPSLQVWVVYNFNLILGDNLGHLKEEVQELQTTLKEEQFYSTELKKEVERLSTAVHKSTEEQTVETSEIDLYETQIKALSEAKDLRKFE